LHGHGVIPHDNPDSPNFAMRRSSSLLKNLEMESFVVLAGRCWSGSVELDVIF
jgi:hypothetical protein